MIEALPEAVEVPEHWQMVSKRGASFESFYIFFQDLFSCMYLCKARVTTSLSKMVTCKCY